MNSEKVKEIKKALECCANLNGKSSCKDCPIGKKCYEDENLMPRLALALINELESENESCHEVLADLKTIIKQQNDRIAELEKEIKGNPSYAKGYADGIKNTYEVVIPDKLKQFAERLKEKLSDKIGYDKPYVMRNIDETLKEFLSTTV